MGTSFMTQAPVNTRGTTPSNINPSYTVGTTIVTMANKISYVQNSEPEFIKKFKQKIGYKEGPTVDTKRQQMPDFDEDDNDRPELDDEKPVVVVLKTGDLSQEEVEKIEKEQKKTDSDEPPSDGKIVFKKPTKRSSDESSDLNVSTSKKKKEEKLKKKLQGKEIKNKSLLSFDEDQEDT